MKEKLRNLKKLHGLFFKFNKAFRLFFFKNRKPSTRNSNKLTQTLNKKNYESER